MAIKTIIFDIDETLVDNEKYPQNIELIRNNIRKLKQHNYSFGICTNRPLNDFVEKIVDTYLIDDLIICEGGAIIYKKIENKYKIIARNIKKNINNIIRQIINSYNLDSNVYILNNKRKSSATIILKNNDILLSYLRKCDKLRNFYIEQNKNKIFIYSKKVDKIKAINSMYKDRNIIFVTDYEKIISQPNQNILLYSVGIDDSFNKKCHSVFSKSSIGVLEILMKEGRKYGKI